MEVIERSPPIIIGLELVYQDLNLINGSNTQLLLFCSSQGSYIILGQH